MPKAAVGIDVGGTFAKLALVSPSGKVLREAQLPTQASQGPAAFLKRAGDYVEAWRKASRLELVGVGLGLAGDVDSERGRLRFAPNLRGWSGFPFGPALSKRLKAPVVVDNDANMAVWGGYVLELKRRPANMVGVTLGTGVGGGVILGGRLYRGSTGSAGEIGHMRVADRGELCHCGSRGCLEAYAGSYGIARLARKALASPAGRKSLLRRLCPSLSRLEPAHVSAAAERGDRLAQEIWAEVGARLAVGLGNLVLALNPDVVLILGGVSRAGRWLLGPVRRHLAAQPFRTPFERVKVRLADNPHAGGLGAALLAMERQA